MKVTSQSYRPTKTLKFNWKITECYLPPPTYTYTLSPHHQRASITTVETAKRIAKCRLSLRRNTQGQSKYRRTKSGILEKYETSGTYSNGNIFKSKTTSQINRNSHSRGLCTSVPIMQYKFQLSKKLQGVLKRKKSSTV